MPETSSQAALLPHAAPANPDRRLLLFGIRRMAAGGITDAHAAHAFFTGFGLRYRRPLVLMRALMAELSRVSTVKLIVAPCCCPRMTCNEAALIDSIAAASARPDIVHEALNGLLKVRTSLGVLASAQAVAAAFEDIGMLLHDCNNCKRADPV